MSIFRFGAVALVAATFVASAITPAAAAKPEIQGDVHALTIRVENASVDETLKALEASFDLRFRAPGPLAKSISGSYQGSLKQVLKRVLNGYDFVLTTRGTAIEVAVIGKSSAPAAAGTPVQSAEGIAKPTTMTTIAKQKSPVAAAMQVAALDTERPAAPGVGRDAVAGPVPQVFAQNDASKMPMPSTEGGAMPMPTPSASGSGGPVPQPSTSGATMPMPTPQANTSGSAGVPTPPAAMMQAPSEAAPASPPAPAAKRD